MLFEIVKEFWLLSVRGHKMKRNKIELFIDHHKHKHFLILARHRLHLRSRFPLRFRLRISDQVLLVVYWQRPDKEKN